MGQETGIQWTDSTFNPVRGCTKVSDGCKFCYAETLSHRNPKVLGMWGPQGTRVMASESMWCEPVKWNKEAKEAGKRHKVFCASLADVFEDDTTCQNPDAYKVVTDARARLWKLIEATPNLDWQLLTKRPQNILRFVPEEWQGGFPPNVWCGTSVEDSRVLWRVDELLKVPAVVRFLSCEPLIGELDISDYLYPRFAADDPRHFPRRNGIEWVIAGGESGHDARPMHPAWVESIRDQCQEAGVPFFFKQFGNWCPAQHRSPAYLERHHESVVVSSDGSTSTAEGGSELLQFCRAHKDSIPVYNVGKKESGRTLTGKTYSEFPTPFKEATP